ncbi:CASP8-associated protein 2 [Malaclemys terrapin pileata]|uniref:CASP8-associated protein 2 n=1 Tax=Malaclemys terrapin pileata TaxID=2991368 RepID=UPI0023A8F64D|nr:CASP8-associated protein 2 [Malaclemys terrapin pileata]XP_053880120.1 CASP8-associated protein 2 [Malaclemys terrapin pileata]XP_053880121.1 CASP8-associated protein 2 [Malaclemys terrapin pileata]
MATDDDGLTLCDIPCDASSLRDDDESSVDIYDGLDSTSVVLDNPAQNSTPTRNCLNLFDEILIEEGTAKEATYNDLKAEYGKCQQQIKELMKKFKEVQAQNSILQNENQALKKNISALIKTARVEINRKDEEISNLHQRLSEFPSHRNNYARTYLSGSTNTRCSEINKTKDPKFRAASLVDNTKTDHRLKTDCSKDVHHSYSSHNMEDGKSHSERRNSPYLLRYPPEELCNDSSRACFQNFDHYSNKGNRREREMKNGEQYSKANDNRYKRDTYQSTGNSTDSEQGNTDSHQNLQIYSEKSGKSELQQESKSKKLKGSPPVENRTDRCISTWEKQTTIKERSQTVESQGDEKGERSQNINKQDLETLDKDEKNFPQKNKSTGKQQEQPRRSGRVNSPHSKNETAKSPHKSHKCPVEDCRRGTDGDCKRDRGASDHSSREARSSPSTSSNREHKHIRSKENSSRYEWETTYSKSERHRTEEKRKRDKENQEESRHPRNERKVTKEITHQTAKESKKVTDATKNERNKLSKPEETPRVADGLKEHKAKKAKEDKNGTKKEDLKLSFMEKLNLTLSPAKTQPLCQNNGIETDSKKASSEDSTETPGHTEMLTPAQPISIASLEQTKVPVQTNLEPKTPVSEIKRKTENEALTETLDLVQPEALAETVDELQPELTNDNTVSLPEAGVEMEEADKTCTAPELESPMNHDEARNIDYDDLETISSDDFESHSVADDIRQTKSDSLMQVVDTNDGVSGESYEYPAKENSALKTIPYKEGVTTSEPTDGYIPADGGVPVVDQNTCNLEQNLPEPEINALTSSHSDKLDPRTKARETNPVPADDDNSILSIDLNHLRYIPKVISPLNSPMRPLAKALRMESPCKGLVKSYNKDLTSESTVACPSKTLSNEVNKENQKPVCSPDKHLEMESQLSISSDELEEGEIVSDDEKSKSERNSENSKISRGRASPETHNLSSSPHNQMNKTASCNEDSGKLVYKKGNANKSREKHKSGATRSSKERKKNKTVSIACLEKIVQIILEPSTVQEIMQMLKAIRKQIRKNYMKFKMHFPVQHFHRIIESAILNFTSLIKYLNFSKMSRLGETLKLTLCETIESKLRHVKKNATVEQLFEQQLSDMKKQLWKFVDERLDYLFEKIKRILVKLCDLVSIGNERDEGKLEIRTTHKQKCTTGHKNDVQKSRKKSLKVKSQKSEEYVLPKPVVNYQPFNKCHHDKNKTDAPKNVITKCLNSIDNTRNSQTQVLPSKENNLQGTLTPLKSARYEKEGFHMVRDAHKSDFNYELLTEQQTSSLTFNLVSDAQMGEIFKSLLQGSDLLEKSISSIDTDQWEFRTPEKQILESQKCRNNPASVIEEAVPIEACVKSRPVEGINWPAVSPERASSLSSRLQMPVDPDVLDESCMFEVPPSAVSSKDDECSLQRNKSFVSSILLEDLAVSLTIPSPLKSDAHLSFLKPENTSGSTPEGVLSAHYSEDALLEEEDATEQDIHLALESDNSSSRSSCSSWTSRPIVPGFPCDPSLPMQAVIMEKSNDHFIVKIRRAVPSTSPTLDQTTLTEESLVSLTKKEKEENISAKIKKDNQDTTGTTVEEKDSKSDMNVIDSTDELCNVSSRQEQAHDLPEPLKEPHSATGKDDAPNLYKPFSETSNKNSHGSENTSEDFKLSQMHELKVPENKREISNTSVESPVKAEVAFPSECSVDAYIDLTEDIANESEVDLCNLAVESTLKVAEQEIHIGNLDKGDTKEEPLECSVNAYIDLTEELSSEIKADECNSKTKSTLNVDLGCQTSLDKTSKKRKKESVTDNSKSKKTKKETESASERNDKSSKKSEEKGLAPKRSSSKRTELPENKDPSTSSTSPRSLYAKNIIKKKGEVVVSWTRNDDREILLECQKNGPSGKTFISIAARLNKSPNQVSERFKQLMKLFKKSKCK